MITLVIPTYRRPDLALQALRSAQEQTLEQFEILLVDNAADAALRATLERFNQTARIPARYVPEARLGLHNARHAAVRAAEGDLLIFTDDDATFDSGWLAAFERAFALHPEMAAAGGPARPVWDVEPPDWLRRFVQSSNPAMFPDLSLIDLSPTFLLEPRDLVFFGVNMAVRRQVVFDLGGFNPDSFGNRWLGDGETGLNRKLWQAGLPIGWVPDAVVYHHVPPERMTLQYFRRRQANDGACDAYAEYHAMPRIPAPPRLLLDALRLSLANLRDWAGALVLRGGTDPRALRVQLRAARTQERVRYVVRLATDATLRALVLKQDWLNEPYG